MMRIYLFPNTANGCNDQYEGASDSLCIRVSSFPETYDDAQARCGLEGAQLLQVTSQEVHVRPFTHSAFLHKYLGFRGLSPFLLLSLIVKNCAI